MLLARGVRAHGRRGRRVRAGAGQRALEHPVDYKSTLQERLAQRGEVVAYEVTAERGPLHDRTFEVSAGQGNVMGTGSASPKKHAEQEAVRVALESLEPEETAESPA